MEQNRRQNLTTYVQTGNYFLSFCVNAFNDIFAHLLSFFVFMFEAAGEEKAGLAR